MPTNPVSTQPPVQPIIPKETLSGEEYLLEAASPVIEIPDSLTISSRDMGKLTAEFCSYDGDSYRALEVLKNAAKLIVSSSGGPYGNQAEDPNKPSQLDDVKKNEFTQLFNQFILLVNEPKRDWCRGGVSGGGWPYKSQSTNAPAYTLNRGLWSMTKVFFPWQNSDTYSFCEVHNDYLQTTREELPNEIRVMIEKQAEINGFQDYDETKKSYVPWNAARIADFNTRLNACVDTIKGKESYVNYGGNKYDLREFCVEVMSSVSPKESAEDKPTGSYARWGGAQDEPEKTPVGRLEALLNERLLDIKWNRWTYREEFCKDVTTKWSHKAIGIMTDVIAVIVPFITWGGRLLIVILAEKTIIKLGRKIGNLIDKVRTKIGKKKKDGGDGSPPAPTGTGADAKAPAGADATKGAEVPKEASMSAIEQELAPLGRYASDIAPVVAQVPLWRRFQEGVRGWVGAPYNVGAAAFGGAQAGAQVFLGIPVPVVP